MSRSRVPGPIKSVPNITDAQSFTPTWTNLTIGNGTESWYWWRFGPILNIQGFTTLGSTSSIGGSVSMTIPVGGITIENAFGTAHCVDASGTDSLAIVNTLSSTEIRFITSDGGAVVAAAVPFTWTTSDQLKFSASLIITEWS